MNLQELALQNTQQMQNITSLISTVKSSQNPEAMVNQMISSNPLARQAQQIA